MRDAVYAAAAVVLGGAAFTMPAAFSPSGIKAGFSGLGARTGNRRLRSDIEFLIQLAEDVRLSGNAAIGEAAGSTADPFMRGALVLAANGLDADSLRRSFALRIRSMEETFGEAERFWQFAATAYSAWGMIGSLAGLAISVFGGMYADAGLYAAVASASLGILFSICAAMPAFLRVKSKSVSLSRRMHIVAEGLSSIKEGDTPRLLREKLRYAGGLDGGLFG